MRWQAERIDCTKNPEKAETEDPSSWCQQTDAKMALLEYVILYVYVYGVVLRPYTYISCIAT
jgi:hypothetical protein